MLLPNDLEGWGAPELEVRCTINWYDYFKNMIRKNRKDAK
jgi:hypothetical protein